MTATAMSTATSSHTQTLTATNTQVAPSETATATLTSVANTETPLPTDTATMSAEVTEPVQAEITETATIPAEETEPAQAETSEFQIIGGRPENADLIMLQQVGDPNTSTLNINFDDPLPFGVSYTIFSELYNAQTQVNPFDCTSLLGGGSFGAGLSACSFFQESDNLTTPTALSVRVRVDLGDDFVIARRPITPSRYRFNYNTQHVYQIRMFDENENQLYFYDCGFNVSTGVCNFENDPPLPTLYVTHK